MGKYKKLMIIILVIILFLTCVLVYLLNYRANMHKRGYVEHEENTNSAIENIANQIVDESKDNANNEINQTNENQNVTQSESKNTVITSITYKTQSEVYKIEGSKHTITVNQDFATVNCTDSKVKERLQANLDKIANDEFEDYKKEVEKQINGEYPIQSEFMDYVGDLSISWSFENSRIDRAVVSVKNESSGSLGGVPWTQKAGVSFSAKTGEQLKIKDIANNETEFKKHVRSVVIDYLKSSSSRLSLYEDAIEELDSIIDMDNIIWYLSENGFTVCFNKYEISPYTFEYTIRYEKLKDYMKEEYIK